MVIKLNSKKYEHLWTFIERFSSMNFSFSYMRKIGSSSQIKDMFSNYDSKQTQIVGGMAWSISLAAPEVLSNIQ